VIDKQQLRANKQRIRDVLFHIWDPIGVSHFSDWPEDEYSGYEGRVHYLLRTGAPDDEIIDYLIWAESRMAGTLEGARERLQGVIHALRALEIPVQPN
jgi:hypothetical protein